MNKYLIKTMMALAITGIIFTLFFASIHKMPLQADIHITYKKALKIEKILKKNGIIINNIQRSDRKGMDDDVTAYDFTDKKNNAYLLLLDNENKSLLAVLNDKDELLFGMLESGMGFENVASVTKATLNTE